MEGQADNLTTFAIDHPAEMAATFAPLMDISRWMPPGLSRRQQREFRHKVASLIVRNAVGTALHYVNGTEGPMTVEGIRLKRGAALPRGEDDLRAAPTQPPLSSPALRRVELQQELAVVAERMYLAQQALAQLLLQEEGAEPLSNATICVLQHVVALVNVTVRLTRRLKTLKYPDTHLPPEDDLKWLVMTVITSQNIIQKTLHRVARLHPEHPGWGDHMLNRATRAGVHGAPYLAIESVRRDAIATLAQAVGRFPLGPEKSTVHERLGPGAVEPHPSP